MSAEQATALLVRKPGELAAGAKNGLAVEAGPALIGLGRAQGFGEIVAPDGEVTSQGLTGLEEALVVIAVIGFFSGLAVGYLKGYQDGQAAAAETTDEGDDDGGGDSHGDDGDGTGDGGEEPGGGRN